MRQMAVAVAGLPGAAAHGGPASVTHLLDRCPAGLGAEGVPAGLGQRVRRAGSAVSAWYTPSRCPITTFLWLDGGAGGSAPLGP